MKWNLGGLVLGVLFGFILLLTFNSGPKEGAGSAPLQKCCVVFSFELKRFSTPLLFSSERLLSKHFLTRELGIVIGSLTIRGTSLGAYPNCSCTQITTYSSFHSDKRKLEGFNILVLFLVRVRAERQHVLPKHMGEKY